jgi:hypothetical protein
LKTFLKEYHRYKYILMTGEASNKKRVLSRRRRRRRLSLGKTRTDFVSIVGGVLVTQYAIQSTVCLGGDLANKQAVSISRVNINFKLCTGRWNGWKSNCTV